MAETETMIDMRGIVKSYAMGKERLTVLRGIDLQVNRGEFVAILGPSGSGKSTLMNIIGCMDLPDSGEYYLSGIRIHGSSDRELTKIRNRQIGFVFQKYQLISKYNVLENVAIPLLVRGQSRRAAYQTAMERIRAIGLADRVRHHPNELSGGQQQRVAIARALVGQPAVLLADEPTGALDTNTGREVLALFEELNRQGNTIVVITHDHKGASYAHRIVHIVDGEIGEEPHPEDRAAATA
jgi:putative ABC transport system ATP-binding protein